MKYRVTLTETVKYTMDIEAESPEDAATKGADLYEDGKFCTDMPDLEEAYVETYDEVADKTIHVGIEE